MPIKDNKKTVFSKSRKYRYSLYREWDITKPLVLFIGVNPSKADETNDDPTLKKCIKYAKSWGYGRVGMANLFAYIATNPNDMKACENPIGNENNEWLIKLAKEAQLVVAAWGDDGDFLERPSEVVKLIPDLHCIRINKSGEPSHPLYQDPLLQPKLFKVKG